MNSSSVKRTILLLLALVMLYVWWNNLNQFTTSDGNVEDFLSMPDNDKESRESAQPVITYRPPRLNPFKKHVNPPLAKPTPGGMNEIRPQRLYLEAGCKLSGILSKGKSSQAVIVVPDMGTRVLSLGDSLEGWQLIGIKEMAAIFKHGRYYDTLCIEQSRR